MKLIMSPASPFARKARVTLRELALMDTVSEVAVATTAFNSDPAVNNRWMSHLNGPLDAAQISIACALSYLDLRHDARNWRQGNDALAAWHATFCARDSMLATKPE